MSSERAINDPDRLLRIAATPSRDGLRISLIPLLGDDVVHAKTALGFEGGPFSEKVCRAIRDTGVMPRADVMSGQAEEAGLSWPREVLELARWGDEYAPWQCFAAWVLLTWVADPADDQASVAEDETVCSLAHSASQLTPDICANAISYLRWHAPARNESGPAAYHELAKACLYAAMFRACPGKRLHDALDEQCQHVLYTADRELLEAIDRGSVYNLQWPLNLTESLAREQWQSLCESFLAPFDARAMPPSADKLLAKLRHGY